MAAGADLLEEHLGEIRSLRQRLEESICTNDRLREQLQHRLSAAARGSGRAHGRVPGLAGSVRRVGHRRAPQVHSAAPGFATAAAKGQQGLGASTVIPTWQMYPSSERDRPRS